jgi:hypothetical protein
VFLDHERDELLDDLMTALNRLAAAGCPVTAADGRLSCSAGVVVPSARGRWASRPLVASFPPANWPALGEDRDEDGFF